MSPRIGNDALCGIDELPALEHTEVLEVSRDLIFRYTGERLCNFGTGQTTVSNLVQLPFCIHGEGHESAFEYQSLFDCGSTTTFCSKSIFVDKLGFKPSGNCVTVKNGDGRSPLSMGSIKVTMSIGCNFKSVMTVQIISLDSFDFVIGLDMIKTYKMELRHDPFRVTAISYNNLWGPFRLIGVFIDTQTFSVPTSSY
jgi:hypothetical protein